MNQQPAFDEDADPLIESNRNPFTLEVVKNALAAVADEMAATIQRTARSFVVKEALDYSTAVFGAHGDLIAQGTCLPLHMGAMPYAIIAVQDTFAGEMLVLIGGDIADKLQLLSGLRLADLHKFLDLCAPNGDLVGRSPALISPAEVKIIPVETDPVSKAELPQLQAGILLSLLLFLHDSCRVDCPGIKSRIL